MEQNLPNASHRDTLLQVADTLTPQSAVRTASLIGLIGHDPKIVGIV